MRYLLPSKEKSSCFYPQIPRRRPFIFVGDAAGPPVLSPDGKNLAFVAAKASEAPQIYVRPLGSLDARALPGTDNAWAPFWSPDGRRIGFLVEGKLKVIGLQGGTRSQWLMPPMDVGEAGRKMGRSFSLPTLPLPFIVFRLPEARRSL